MIAKEFKLIDDETSMSYADGCALQSTLMKNKEDFMTIIFMNRCHVTDHCSNNQGLRISISCDRIWFGLDSNKKQEERMYVMVKQ